MHTQLVLYSDMVAYIPFKFLYHLFVLLDYDHRGRGIICSQIRIKQDLSIEFKAMLVCGLQMMVGGWLLHECEILG